MSAHDRREQLIEVGQQVFAEQGVQSVSVEEVAKLAGVTKPVIYEHFGGKAGLYAVIVERAIQDLLRQISVSLAEGGGSRQILERTAWALLTYVEQSPAAFRILVRDSPSWHGSGSIASLMSDVAVQVEGILGEVFKRQRLDTKPVPIYAQMLIGMIALTGEWWLESGRTFKKEFVAAHMVNLAWNGLTGLEPKPTLGTVKDRT